MNLVDQLRFWLEQVFPYLFYIVARLCTGLDKHDAQFFGSLFSLFNCYLPEDTQKRRENCYCSNIARKG